MLLKVILVLVEVVAGPAPLLPARVALALADLSIGTDEAGHLLRRLGEDG